MRTAERINGTVCSCYALTFYILHFEHLPDTLELDSNLQAAKNGVRGQARVLGRK